MAENRQKLHYFPINDRANRRNCCIFFTRSKRNEPPASAARSRVPS